MKLNQAFVLTILIAASSGTALAQAPPSPATQPAQTAPAASARAGSGCAPTQSNAQGAIAPTDTTTGQRAEPLGDRLARSDGVLCPPSGVDPDIRAPTPEVGNTPVIPPPGSPGGDPTIRPK